MRQHLQSVTRHQGAREAHQAGRIDMHAISRSRRSSIGAIVALGLMVCPHSMARADVFLLHSGGQVEGEWLNQDEQPLIAYQVRTHQGIVVRLQATDVRESIRQTAEQQEYERLSRSAADTIEGQWKLAEWCRRNGLLNERKRHLLRILDHDSNHADARKALGFAFVEGKWVTQGEFRREEGYEHYKGRWRTAQEIEILEARAKHELAERDWLSRLRRLRQAMNDRNKTRSAVETIRGIKDPVAIRPLNHMMSKEPLRDVKMLYADVLASIDTAESAQALVYASLNDPDEEIFYYCVDRLVQMKQHRVVDAYIDALRDPRNETVNKAAVALGRLNERSAVSPLIDALITTHTLVKPSQYAPDATAVSFNHTTGTSMMKNDSAHVYITRIQNQHVLHTLSQLSGGSNFGFDQRAWRYWYAQEKRAEQAAGQVERRPSG